MVNTKQILVGGVKIGGGAPISIQSMLSVSCDDIVGNVNQAKELEAAGCDIIRVAIPRIENINLIPALKAAVKMPVVADIHFDWRIALEAAAAGADKLRINPGNIGGEDRVKEVAKACRLHNIPIRIGVNSGSVEKEILKKHGHPTAMALVESALYHASLLEKFDFSDIVLSLKASNVELTINSYRLASERSNYPLHLGVTEAGTLRMGLVKSAIGIGSLLIDGIGDTIRVSLTDSPIEEIKAAKDILKAVGKGSGVNIVSCPTCGRTKIDLIGLAKKVEDALEFCNKNITVAVMGCAVNGPGEAKEADFGVAGGDDMVVLFKKGVIVGSVPQDEALGALLKLIENEK